MRNDEHHTEELHFKPDPANWFGVALFLLLVGGIGYLLTLITWKPGDVGVFLLFAFMLLILAVLPVVISLQLLCCRVQLSPKGIAWRTIRGWKRSSWEEVSDYYEWARLGYQRTFAYDIITAQGRVRILADWKGADFAALQSLVQERATNASAKAWENYHLRLPEGQAQTFSYRKGDNVFLTSLLSATGLLMLGMFVFSLAPQVIQRNQSLGIGWVIGGMLVALCLCGMPLLLLFALRGDIKKTWQRRAEHIEIAEKGITFRDNSHTRFAPWEKVRDYYYFSPQHGGEYILDIEDGEITFTSHIDKVIQLRALIQQYATAAQNTEWHVVGVDQTTLGSVADRWTSGRQGVGDRIFHYRTLNCRGALRMVCFVTLVFVGLTPVQSWIRTDSWMPSPEGFIFPLLMVITTLWCWWRYAAARIIIEQDGIVQYTPFGRRFLAWNNIVSYTRKTDTLFFTRVLTGADKKRIRFASQICELVELEAEILRRIPATVAEEASQKA
jgi:hypothetical protein